MTPEASQILDDALGLPQQARAFLAERLLESLDIEADFGISDAWRAEISRRCAEIDDGSVKLIPADQAFARAYASLG